MRTGVQDRPAVQVGVDDRASAQFPLLAVTGFAGLFKRPASRWARAALVAVNLAAVTAFLLSYSRHGVGFGPYRIDLGVYRFAGPAPQWAPWQQAIGSSYVLFAAFILLLAASGRLTPQTPTARTTPTPITQLLVQSVNNREIAIPCSRPGHRSFKYGPRDASRRLA